MVNLFAHSELQSASGEYVGVGDVGSAKPFPIECDVFYILIGVAEAVGNHCELSSIRQVYGGFRNLGRAQDVFSGYRINGIEAQGAEDVPCRHLSAVIIAAQTVGSGVIEAVEHFTNQFGGSARLACDGVEICHVVARLVAMGILSDESGHVAKCACLGSGGIEEKQ